MQTYLEHIHHPSVEIIGREGFAENSCPWLCTILVKENRFNLVKKLRENGIESAQVHYRNDRYTIFGERRKDLPNMDAIEDKYLVLPLHHKVTKEDCIRICEVINKGW